MATTEKKPLVISDTEASVIHRKFLAARMLFLICYAVMLLLFCLLNLFLDQGSFKLLLVQCVPLLIFVPGLVQQRYRTYSWICFVILPYFTWSVVNVMSPLIRWHDIAVLILSVIIFVTAMMASRWLQYWQVYEQQVRTRSHVTEH